MKHPRASPTRLSRSFPNLPPLRFTPFRADRVIPHLYDTCYPMFATGQGFISDLLIKPKTQEVFMTTTTDLTKFGSRERKMAEELLKAWREQGLPEDFYEEEVTIMFNTHSGYVFLTNSEFQVAMLNDDKLESFYTDFETGEEGFKDELSAEAKKNLNLT